MIKLKKNKQTKNPKQTGEEEREGELWEGEMEGEAMAGFGL